MTDNAAMGGSQPSMPRIAVLGAGALGSYFGSRLARASAAEVHLIARGDHLAALRAEGLTVHSVDGDYRVEMAASDDPAAIGPVDFVFFTVKSYDTQDAARRLAPLLGAETAVISFQNGVDNEDKLAAVIEPDHVMGGTAYVLASLEGPGVVRHAGGPGRLVFGELDGRPSQRAERLLAACGQAAIPAEVSRNIRAELWSKYAFILAHAGMTAAVRLPIGDIRNSSAAWEMFQAIVEEACRVGRGEGIDLPEDLVARHLAFAQSLPPGGYSSLYHDLTAGRRLELSALHGELLRRADNHHLATPASRAVFATLEPWALRAENGRRQPSSTGEG
ncbi:MAG: ketopantoate reductase family protein [Candidatus Limnocylindria bacterium]